MPVGAILAGGAALGGSLLAAKATKKAANTASQTATENTAANNALAREIYGGNVARSTPFVNQGLAAGNTLGSYLGLPGGGMTAPQTSTFAYPPAGGYTAAGGRLGGSDLFMQPGVSYAPRQYATSVPSSTQQAVTNQLASQTPVVEPGQPGDPYSQFLEGGNIDAGVPQSEQLTSGMIGTALDPGSFTDYRDSTGYDFRLGEGVNALSQQFAAGGALNSGAAAKALVQYGQDYGSNEYQNFLNQLNNYITYNDQFRVNERGYQDARGDYGRAYRQDNYRDYLDRLTNQQGMGLSAVNALSGVGTNYVGQVTSNNNNAANIAANAAIARGAASNQLYSDVGNSLGRILGGIKF